ncbi:MAG: type III secretion system chaperone [Kiritimatiellae bacterium]|nr:type III secretion system chaperone [Kiritimatiellia bacterium]
MSYEDLITQFGAQYGIEGLESRDGAAALLIDGMKIEIISDEAADCAVIYAEIGHPSPTSGGKLGETMLKANHLFLGTSGGTLCQNPDTDAYALMRPVPLARLESAEAFGAILEDVLSQVENWRQVLAGMREAESAEVAQQEEAAMLASGGFMQV